MKDFLDQPLQNDDYVVIIDTGHIEPMKHAQIICFHKHEAGWFAKIKYRHMYGSLTSKMEFPCRYMIKIDPSLSKMKESMYDTDV